MDGSLFTPGREIWTAEAAELVVGVVGDPDQGSGSFIEKLESQLLGLRADAVQLAAETQGLVYWIVQGEPPEDWSEADQEALLAAVLVALGLVLGDLVLTYAIDAKLWASGKHNDVVMANREVVGIQPWTV